MPRRALSLTTLAAASAFSIAMGAGAQQTASPEDQAACAALLQTPNLTITYATVITTRDGATPYCYVKGILPPAIGFHVQLPLPSNWNGRYLNWGDGGKDGDLDFADHRVAEGYAVSNSNTGHDNAAEPGSSFAYNNRQAEIDFGYRAIHLTVMAAKSLTARYYGRDPSFSYFEGCSTGGRQGLMEAQRYPYDFDGIIAGAPAQFYQEMNATSVWLTQKMYKDDYAGSLSFDSYGDGVPDSPRKLELLIDAVLERCDEIDGIRDGVIEYPPSCDFVPERDLAGLMCRDDVNADDCFTRMQVDHIEDFYSGSYDSFGTPIYPGRSLGSEAQWLNLFVPYEGNGGSPGVLGIAGDHLNYLFYENDPGVAMPVLADRSLIPDPQRNPPEWAWWQFDIDDVTRGMGDFMKSITDATDPDLSRFLLANDGKLILYHGWSDALIVPEGTRGYYENMVATTFGGDMDAAKERARLFMIPGMGHCAGGPSPNSWVKLPPLVDWVERGIAPDAVVATPITDGVVDDERPIFAYPDLAAYSGPAGGQNDRANWVRGNFRPR